MEDQDYADSSANRFEDSPSPDHEHHRRDRKRKAGGRSFPWKILVAFLVISLLGFVGWFILTPPPEAEVSEDVSVISNEETNIATNTPSPTPEPVEKSEITFEILNGTGIAGEAGSLEEKINGLGYEQFEVGNADEDNYEATTVTYRSALSQTVKDEITTFLEGIYEKVEVKTQSSPDYDVSVIIGYKKGHTPTPTESEATSTATPTPTGSVTGSTTPTVTSTVTPTP